LFPTLFRDGLLTLVRDAEGTVLRLGRQQVEPGEVVESGMAV
jgi:hypothetical protein